MLRARPDERRAQTFDPAARIYLKSPRPPGKRAKVYPANLPAEAAPPRCPARISRGARKSALRGLQCHCQEQAR